MNNQWTASNYRTRTSQRLASIAPHWIKNPATGEEFYLRKVGGLMSTVLAGYMPSGLTKIAIDAWKKKGVEGMELDDAAGIAAGLTPEQLSAGEREMETLSHIIQQSCVIPLLSSQDPSELQFTDEWKQAATKGLMEKDKKFDAGTFDFKELVLNPRELDEKDTEWLFKWAGGLAGSVGVKGGNVTDMSDVASFRKPLARRSRTRTDKSELQKVS